jgi:predicted anti-sigma-YlaC factor YlaD
VAIAVSEWSCARARRALSLVLDHEEVEGDLRSLAVHLGSCPPCRQFAADVTQFTNDLRALRVGHLEITDRDGRENGYG